MTYAFTVLVQSVLDNIFPGGLWDYSHLDHFEGEQSTACPIMRRQKQVSVSLTVPGIGTHDGAF